MNKNELFESVGFVDEYREEFQKFYRPFFNDESALDNFFYDVFKNDVTDKKPRWIMNQIVWFVTLADDIDKIRPRRDPLRILFFKICLESICKINDLKTSDFFEKFEKCFSEEGKNYILSHFKFSFIDEPIKFNNESSVFFDNHEGYDLTISDFLLIVKATRDIVAHDGDYWSTQFFAQDNDSTWITSITTKENIISCHQGKKSEYITYHFETTMQYERFRYYFVEACINYLKE